MCFNFKPFNVKAADCKTCGPQQLISKIAENYNDNFLTHFLMNMKNFGRN